MCCDEFLQCSTAGSHNRQLAIQPGTTQHKRVRQVSKGCDHEYLAANMPAKWAVTNIVWALTLAARQISSSVWVQLVGVYTQAMITCKMCGCYFTVLHAARHELLNVCCVCDLSQSLQGAESCTIMHTHASATLVLDAVCPCEDYAL